MATRTHINISDKTSNGRRLSQAEIEANRRRLAAVIAHREPGKAIVAPPGVGDLKEIGIKPSKPKREIFEMDNEPDVITGPEQPPATTPAGRRPRLTDEKIRAIHAEYIESQNSIQMVADLHGITYQTLNRRFHALGLELLPPGGNRKAVSAHGGRRTDTKAKREPLPKPVQLSDQAIREIHADWMRCGGSLLDVAMRYRIDQNILRKRFRALELDDTGVRIPYERPSVATLPLNGDGKHAEAARQMVAEAAVAFRTEREMAESVGAQTSPAAGLGSDTVSPPKPEETAVLPIVGYGILHDMIGLLPVHGRWTAEERGLWLDAFTAPVKLYTREARPAPAEVGGP